VCIVRQAELPHGLAHIERGYLRTMICYRCLRKGVSLSDFKTKTRADTAKQIAAKRAARAANADRTNQGAQ
jgi:hypothetical protein